MSVDTRRLLASEGEADGFEFKETPDAVTTSVLVAAANASALDGLEHTSILIGVREQSDPVTGLVKHEVCGVEGVEAARERIDRLAREIGPKPPEVSTFVENVRTSRPILRLQIRPTRPPHHDARGAWIARPGSPIRTLTETELLELYLAREGRRLASTLSDVAAGYGDKITELTEAVERLGDRVRLTHRVAREALNATKQQQAIVSRMEELVTAVRSELASTRVPVSFEEAWWELNEARTRGWLAFERKRASAFRAETILREVLATHTDPLDYEGNLVETEAWNALASLPEDSPPSEWIEYAEMVRDAAGRRHYLLEHGGGSRNGSKDGISVIHS